MRRVISGTIHFLEYLNKPLNANQAGDVRMNRNLIVLILLSVFVAPVMADKPEWAGKGKPTDEQKAAHKSAMEAKGDSDDDDNRLKEKKEKKDKSSKLKGIEKQSAKKSEQELKELEKGSDKGKASREENRKKWWKFWGE